MTSHAALPPIEIPRENWDFEVVPEGGGWRIVFDDSRGYRPLIPYDPFFRYMPARTAWRTSLGAVDVWTRDCPLRELAFELRGYLLGGEPLPGSLVVDAGPGLSGLFGLYLAKKIGPENILFIEPDPRALAMLTENIRINRLDGVGVIQAVLAQDEREEIPFVCTEDPEASHIDFQSSEADGNGRPMRVLTLERLLESVPPERGVFLKMDVEGSEIGLAEPLAIQAAARPRLIAAVASYHGDVERGTASILELAARAHDAGATTIFPPHQTTFVFNTANLAAAKVLKKFPGC